MAALHALDTMMGHLTDILAIPKFDKLNPALWEMFFGAAKVLVGLVNGDSILVFNKIIKVKDMMEKRLGFIGLNWCRMFKKKLLTKNEISCVMLMQKTLFFAA